MSIGIWKYRRTLPKMRYHETYWDIRLNNAWAKPTLKDNRPVQVDWIVNRDDYRSYQ
jgi:hypothetical protein